MKAKLSPFWSIHHSKLTVLFAGDREVSVSELKDYKITVTAAKKDKAAALKTLLKPVMNYGNITLTIDVRNADGTVPEAINAAPPAIVSIAFMDNPLFFKVESTSGIYDIFCVFQKQILQFFDDNILDYNGHYSALAANIAADVCIEQIGAENIFRFCTRADGDRGAETLLGPCDYFYAHIYALLHDDRDLRISPLMKNGHVYLMSIWVKSKAKASALKMLLLDKYLFGTICLIVQVFNDDGSNPIPIDAAASALVTAAFKGNPNYVSVEDIQELNGIYVIFAKKALQFYIQDAFDYAGNRTSTVADVAKIVCVDQAPTDHASLYFCTQSK